MAELKTQPTRKSASRFVSQGVDLRVLRQLIERSVRDMKRRHGIDT